AASRRGGDRAGGAAAQGPRLVGRDLDRDPRTGAGLRGASGRTAGAAAAAAARRRADRARRRPPGAAARRPGSRAAGAAPPPAPAGPGGGARGAVGAGAPGARAGRGEGGGIRGPRHGEPRPLRAVLSAVLESLRLGDPVEAALFERWDEAAGPEF